MKHEILFRITVTRPPKDTAMLVQEGKDRLLAPKTATAGKLVFEFPITVDLAGEQPNFLGKFAQGPKGARFVYVNSGTYAGQAKSCWSRRAKLSLMSITSNQIQTALEMKKAVLEAAMPGVGADGGPTCASVKGIEWRIAAK